MSDSATPWTVAYQAAQSMEFSRQKYWNGLALNDWCPYNKRHRQREECVETWGVKAM